ncbi:uncharacterized protein LOC144453690 [Glandiceps talaboti]
MARYVIILSVFMACFFFKIDGWPRQISNDQQGESVAWEISVDDITGPEDCKTGRGYDCQYWGDDCYDSARQFCEDPTVCGLDNMCQTVLSYLDIDECNNIRNSTRESACQMADFLDWVKQYGVLPKFGDNDKAVDYHIAISLWGEGVRFCDDGRIECYGWQCLTYSELCDNGIRCYCHGLKADIKRIWKSFVTSADDNMFRRALNSMAYGDLVKRKSSGRGRGPNRKRKHNPSLDDSRSTVPPVVE